MEPQATMYTEHEVKNVVYRVTAIYQQGKEKEDAKAKIQRLILNHQEKKN